MRRIPSAAFFDSLVERAESPVTDDATDGVINGQGVAGQPSRSAAGKAVAAHLLGKEGQTKPVRSNSQSLFAHVDEEVEEEAHLTKAVDRSELLNEEGAVKVLSPREKVVPGHQRTYSGQITAHSLRFGAKMNEVQRILFQQRLIHGDRVAAEVEWYFDHLGLNVAYFETNSVSDIATHISSLYSAKLVAQLNGTTLRLQLESISAKRAVLVCRSLPGDAHSPALRLEPRIEEQYLGDVYTSAAGGKYGLVQRDPEDDGDDESEDTLTDLIRKRRWKLHCYRTQGTVSEESPIKLRFFFLAEPTYPKEFPAPQPLTETRFERIADAEWLRVTPLDLQAQFHEVIVESTTKLAPSIRVSDVMLPDSDRPQRHLLIAYRHASTHSFLSGISAMYHALGYHSTNKFLEQFSNGISVMSVFLRPLASHLKKGSSNGVPAEFPTDRDALAVGASAMFILPRTSVSFLMRDYGFNPSQHAYTYIAWKFAFHFLGRQSTAFAELEHALARHTDAGSKHLGLLHTIRSQLRLEAFTEGRLLEIIERWPQAASICFADFEHLHNPDLARVVPGATAPSRDISEARTQVFKIVSGATDRRVFEAFLIFNRHIMKTNFFKARKLSYAFRLDPAFLNDITGGFPTLPFGLFFVVGAEFRGFHVRFRDVARGGIRLIRSSNREAFTANCTSQFDENYNLALTQERKNKDIPEGGSKGTILLSLDHQDKGQTAFYKYIDGLLDLLLLPANEIVDYSGRTDPELLFLGPDEGTADLMDFACDHAAKRGYAYAMSFATGKTASSHGGIPHDIYGMTTRSVHAYVLGSLKKLGLEESEVTKVQTGGPDGDLGSNEIKISNDKTVAIVDGSGVLYDADGLDRPTLLDLATRRVMGREFPLEKLGPNGFFVDVDATDFVLPEVLGGERVPSGFDFRNNFHVHPLFKADVFVPCGGRPEAININNVSAYLTPHPRFKIIVEGANLFITQEARLHLEAAGVTLFKDASANKGGVTSSSLEVMAALALKQDEYQLHMCGETQPAFYQKYVQDVISVIEENAQLEFERIWDEHAKQNDMSDEAPARCQLTDTLSGKINELSKMIESEMGERLWSNLSLRQHVLAMAIPKSLQELLGGVDQVCERVPVSYMKATFAAYLASRYVYSCGMTASPEFAFFSFLQNIL